MPLESVSLDAIEINQEPQFKILPRQLNDVLGRILLPRQISVLHCTERFPMTVIAHQIVVSAAKAGMRVFYIDAGGSNYSAALTRALIANEKNEDEIITNISIGLVLGLDDIEPLLESLSHQSNVGVIVIDSLTGLLNLSAAPGTKGRQRKLFKTLEMLRELVNKTESHLLLTDHSSIDWHTGIAKPIGGNIIAHGVDSVVRVTSLDAEKDSVRVQVERCPVIPAPGGVVIKVSHQRGVRSFRSA